MKLNRTSEYAILVCMILARQKIGPHSSEFVGASELAFRLSITQEYIHQIVRKLKEGHLIATAKGPRGGFRLVADPVSITVRDIVDACEGKAFPIVCDEGTINCQKLTTKDSCPLRVLWSDLSSTINRFLESRSLLSLVENWEIDPTPNSKTLCIG